MNDETMRCRELLSSYLTTQGFYTEAENVLSGVDLESYENELALVSFMLTTGCPVKPPERNRASHNPGGCVCMECGCTFIGDESHDLCAVCDNTRAQASAPDGATNRDEISSKLVDAPEGDDSLVWRNPAPHAAAPSVPPTKTVTVRLGDTRSNAKAGEVVVPPNWTLSKGQNHGQTWIMMSNGNEQLRYWDNDGVMFWFLHDIMAASLSTQRGDASEMGGES